MVEWEAGMSMRAVAVHHYLPKMQSKFRNKIGENNFKVCDLITDLNKSYQNLVRKKSAA